jgi:hypothetical protein
MYQSSNVISVTAQRTLINLGIYLKFIGFNDYRRECGSIVYF